jgi:WD40 repeat protein
LIATGSADNHVSVVKVDLSAAALNVTQVADVIAHENDINSVSFCPWQPSILATCSDDGLVKIWKIN